MTFRHLRNARGFFSDYYLGSVFGRWSGHGRCRKLSDWETDLAYARFRIGGQHASPYLLRPIAVLAEGSLRNLASAFLHDARCEETTPYDEDNMAPCLAEVNLTIAKGYGLEPHDFEHILSTFPVFARKRPAFYASLRERLAEWAKEEATTARPAVRYAPSTTAARLRVAEAPDSQKGPR